MRTPRCIPNVLTGLRMVLTFIYLLFLENLNLYSNNKLYFASAGIVFFLICVTDFIDGKIARKIKAESLLGSFLDVTADFIFIISSLALLNLNNIYINMLIWITLILVIISFSVRCAKVIKCLS